VFKTTRENQKPVQTKRLLFLLLDKLHTATAPALYKCKGNQYILYARVSDAYNNFVRHREKEEERKGGFRLSRQSRPRSCAGAIFI
jgi:hypothetical protein